MGGNEIEEVIDSLFVNVPDFPLAGHNYPNVSSILYTNPEILQNMVQDCIDHVEQHKPEKIACIETCGSYLGAPAAYSLRLGLVPLKSRGKLAGEVVSEKYDIVYASGREMQMQTAAVNPNERIFIVDDYLATGGSFFAAKKLIESQGGAVVGAYFGIIEPSLHGYSKAMHSGVPIRYTFSLDFHQQHKEWRVSNKTLLVNNWQ